MLKNNQYQILEHSNPSHPLDQAKAGHYPYPNMHIFGKFAIDTQWIFLYISTPERVECGIYNN